MINFKKVTVKNFLSVGNEPIELNINDGLSIILGENKDKNRSNGSGKSTIIESIYFALFGKTIRGLNKTDVINKKTKKGTEVVLEFSKGTDQYKIVRKLKPSTMELHHNGKDVTRDSISNTQDEISSILGVSEDVIKNCVIMGVNQTVPFMSQTKVEKRKFIEGIFDMNVFSEILKDVRKDYNDAVKNLTALQSKKGEKEKNLEIYREQSDKFEENKAQKIESIKNDINEKRDSKKDLEQKLQSVDNSELDNLVSDYKALRDKLKLVRDDKLSVKRTELTTYDVEIRSLKKQRDNLFKSGVCPTCNREMSDDDQAHVAEHEDEISCQIIELKDKKDVVETDITKINGVIKIIEGKISDNEDKQQSIRDTVNRNDIISNKIEDCDQNIQRLVKNAKAIKAEVNELDEVITKVDKELVSLGEEIDDVIKQTEILDQIKFICGENGVKSYIVNQLLNIFNQSINYYLDKLNANCVLNFDEYFEEKIINDKKQECSYFNFSSGERRNIDIAIMFAFMDLQRLQGKFDTNMLCFDELVDSALDIDGVNYVVDILLEKCKDEDKSIYLITHRKELQGRATGDIITIEKENGISKVKNINN
jgi:DNA repair exonuclease SbcCD ATPase subunit